MKTTLVVWLTVCALCAVSAVSRKRSRPDWCLDGSIGWPCSFNSCTIPGYSCVSGLCCRLTTTQCSTGVVGPECFHFRRPCRDPGHECIGGQCCPVCPNGMHEGGACHFGCRPGYQCINNLCCSSRQRTCPRVSRNIRCAYQTIRRRSFCNTDNDCRNGMLCCNVPCGHRICTMGIYTG